MAGLYWLKAKDRIEPLVGPNQHLWARKIKTLQIYRGLWRIVIGNKAGNRDAFPEAKIAYLYREQNALSVIFMTVSDDCLISTVDTESATDSWTEIEKKYDFCQK